VTRPQQAEEFVLTPLQKGFLAESLMASDQGMNIEQVVWELDRVPDLHRFRAAWQGVLDAFDALRLSFVWSGPREEPRQHVVTPVRLPFQRLDWPERPPGEQDARLEGFLDQDRRAGLDLSSTPLMRVSLLVMGSRAVCVWTIHHAVIDGNSYASVLQRVFDGYAGPPGRTAAPGDGPPQFTDFLRWLKRHDPEPGTRHFTELLRGLDEPTALPLQEGTLRAPASRSSLISLRLDPEETARLQAAAQATGATPNTLVQLAWALLLSHHAGTDDVLFGATWSGRARTIEQAARLVGPVVNTLPVRVRLNEAGTVRELLGAVRRQHVALHPFQQTPLGDIRARSDLAGFAQLFQTNVVFENERFYTTLLRQDGRWRGHNVWSRSQTSLPLVLAAYFLDGVLITDLEYDVGLYPHDTARRLLADYRRLLTNVALSLDASPYAVPMLDEATWAQLAVAESARERLPAGRPVIERIIERASSTPQATAVRELTGREVSYAELERRVRRLASALLARGVERGSLVGILLPRSVDAVVSLLAVHAAGGAFVPLDPAAPLRRLEFIVRDSGAKVVLVGSETRGRLASDGFVELDVESPLVTRGDDSPVPLELPDATSLAYVIYTSGSTGEPKGVCVLQGALANHLAATVELYALGPRDRVLQFAPPVFDVCLEEILPTLAAGATLVLRSEEMAASTSDFLDAVAAEGLTVLNLPTAFWHQLVRAKHIAWPACLRLVVVGGEQVSPEAHRLFRAAGTAHIRWMNAYGPTEAAITSTCYDDAAGDHTPGFVPIGRPLPGVSHFVFDPHMRLAPLGQPGQLYIGGAGLASGYLNRDELTRERFVQHPFRPGARLYAARCTGCHRLYAFALARQHQTGAIAAQRPAPVRVPDHARKPLHIRRKSRFARSAPEIHLSPPR
jgi:amino acid adenylation domain-containing protein